MNGTLRCALLAAVVCVCAAVGGWLYQLRESNSGEQTSGIEQPTAAQDARVFHYVDGANMSGDEIRRESNNVLVAAGNVEISVETYSGEEAAPFAPGHPLASRVGPRLVFRPGTITADRATVNGDTGIIQAEGNVRFRVSSTGGTVVEAPEMTIRYREGPLRPFAVAQ